MFRRFRTREISSFWRSVVKPFDLQHSALCNMPEGRKHRFRKPLLEFAVRVPKSFFFLIKTEVKADLEMILNSDDNIYYTSLTTSPIT